MKALFGNVLEQSVIPDNIQKNPEAPDQDYEIEYVYGFRTFDCRQNLRYSHKWQLVYMVAALGIVLDPETNNMKVFGGG